MAIQALRCIRALDLLQDLIHQGSASDVHIAKVPPASKCPMQKLNCNKYVSAPLRLTTRAKFGVPQELSLQSRSIFVRPVLCDLRSDIGLGLAIAALAPDDQPEACGERKASRRYGHKTCVNRGAAGELYT